MSLSLGPLSSHRTFDICCSRKVSIWSLGTTTVTWNLPQLAKGSGSALVSVLKIPEAIVSNRIVGAQEQNFRSKVYFFVLPSLGFSVFSNECIHSLLRPFLWLITALRCYILNVHTCYPFLPPPMFRQKQHGHGLCVWWENMKIKLVILKIAANFWMIFR